MDPTRLWCISIAISTRVFFTTRCLPFFINIVPVAYPKYEVRLVLCHKALTCHSEWYYSRKVTIDLLKASGLYFYHTKMVVLASSVILLIVYFFGFATLVIMYWKILRHIRRLRESGNELWLSKRGEKIFCEVSKYYFA